MIENCEKFSWESYGIAHGQSGSTIGSAIDFERLKVCFEKCLAFFIESIALYLFTQEVLTISLHTEK